MIDQGMGGDIVYISSKNSVFAGPNNIAYSATKADQAHQVRLLAAELGEYGIKVNGINPDGVVRGSGIFAGGWGAKRAAVYGVAEEELGKYYAQRTLLKREVLPENVANAGLPCSQPTSATPRACTFPSTPASRPRSSDEGKSSCRRGVFAAVESGLRPGGGVGRLNLRRSPQEGCTVSPTAPQKTTGDSAGISTACSRRC